MKSVGACAVATLALGAVDLGVGVPNAHAAKVLSIGATANGNKPVNVLRGFPYNGGLFPSDPEITETIVLDYPASIGVWPFMSMDQSIDMGVEELARIFAENPDENFVISAESQGAMVWTMFMLSKLAENPELAPDIGRVVVVLSGNPATAEYGLSVREAGKTNWFLRATFPGATPNSPYATINVTKAGDFYADVSNGNFWAEAERWAGFAVVHPSYADEDIFAKDNLVKVVGNTTYVLIPKKESVLLGGLISFARMVKGLTGDDRFYNEVMRFNNDFLAYIEKYGYDNRPGFAPINEVFPELQNDPSQEVSRVPSSVSASLRGESDDQIMYSGLQSDIQSGEQDVPQGDNQDLTPPPATEEVPTEQGDGQFDELPVGPEVIEDDDTTDSAGTVEPEQQAAPQPVESPVSAASNDVSGADETGSDEPAENAEKPRKRGFGGFGARLSTERSHRSGNQVKSDDNDSTAPRGRVSLPSGKAAGSTGAPSDGSSSTSPNPSSGSTGGDDE